MTPAQILAIFKAYKVPHERIAKAINRDRSAATKMLLGVRSIKATEIEPLSELARAVMREERLRPLDEEPPVEDHGPLTIEESAALAGTPAYQGDQLPLGLPVQAGAWLEVNVMDQREPGYYPAAPDPRFPRARQWLSPVIGDSMNALTKGGQPAGILDGDFVHVVDAIDIDYRPATGDVVEVERSRFSGRELEVTLKQIEVLPDGEIELWPRSTNPAFVAPIPYRPTTLAAEEIEVRIRAKMLRVIRAF